MNFELSAVDLRLSKGLKNLRAHWDSVMEGKQRKVTFAGEQRRYHNRPEYNNPLPQGRKPDLKRPVPPGTRRRTVLSNYYSLESFVVLICLTASLLILPLILPPLPPPPFLLLLLPMGILVVLLVLALMPSDVRDLTSSYL